MNSIIPGGLNVNPTPAPLPAQSYLYLVAHDSVSAPAEKFAPLSNLFVDLVLPLLTGCEAKVYAFLLRHADRKTGRVVKSLEEICAGAGCSRVTAWRALQRHEALGLLVEQHRFALRDRNAPGPKAAQIRNAYTLTAADQWQVEGVEITVAKAQAKTHKNEKRPVQKWRESAKNEQAKTNASSNACDQTQQHPAHENSLSNAPTPVADVADVLLQKIASTTPEPTRQASEALNASADTGPLATEEALLSQMQELRVEGRVARALLRNHGAAEVAQQLEWLPQRAPHDAAAMLVQAVKKEWGAPAAVRSQSQPSKISAPTMEEKAQVLAARTERARRLRQAEEAVAQRLLEALAPEVRERTTALVLAGADIVPLVRSAGRWRFEAAMHDELRSQQSH